MIRLNFDARNKESKVLDFDRVCDGSVSQKEFYDAVGLNSMIKQVFQGYHASVFAYGQTGSGKTYTMEGYKYT